MLYRQKKGGETMADETKSALPKDLRDLIKWSGLISAAIVAGKVITYVLAL